MFFNIMAAVRLIGSLYIYIGRSEAAGEWPGSGRGAAGERPGSGRGAAGERPGSGWAAAGRWPAAGGSKSLKSSVFAGTVSYFHEN